ncbi:glycosyltransferase family 9 protein [Hydrogenimonas thermophila]|uniref:glycosyltransferase family 9 protein n=1 Tax=Hydrogenimonas thermophila TaxID=223786 RepID=UPI002937383A|nr:glycosyltransferase family 9 protein [Hydrogenimonas thermophila]WOE70349.1 glycosyltransferase family 9 protein [Hydrogenimonas thermophila]WOE72866.1 glycosyltransferase family 9 protein [Hydrogenimonas thermophila]
MKLLIELPTWLGDTVMTTSALENLFTNFKDAEITIIGSYVSTEAIKAHPRISRVYVDNTKQKGIRLVNVYKLAKEIGPHEIALSFRSHFYSKLLLYFTGSKKRFVYSGNFKGHQVEKYQAFINTITGRYEQPNDLKLYHSIKKYDKPTLGINPGATYGSAKRWYPEKFAEVAVELSDKFDIIIFGGPAEVNIANDIENMIRKNGITNLTNLAGKTSISELCSAIAGLDLFITGDSGPMHIAAAYKVPTVAVFGPTKHKETSQWKNPKGLIVRKDLECSPCMKRTCPIKTHECMKEISAKDVLESVQKIFS